MAELQNSRLLLHMELPTEQEDAEIGGHPSGYKPLSLRDAASAPVGGAMRAAILGFVAVLGCVLVSTIFYGSSAHRAGPSTSGTLSLDKSDLELLERLYVDASMLRSLVGNATALVGHAKNATESRLPTLPVDWTKQIKEHLMRAKQNGHLTKALSAAMKRIAPEENLNDGNPCDDDEEMVNRLCYKKCSLLTNGKYTIRSSPWHCCAKSPCVLNQVSDFGICSGFSVAGGDDEACPHAIGACFENEELCGGQCYKQCSILTDGIYPYRQGPATCCKVNSWAKCLLPSNVDTHPDLDVGGGVGDGHKSTPAGVHPPVPALAES